MTTPPPPPPRRTAAATGSASQSGTTTPDEAGWKAKMKTKGSAWGKYAMDKSVVWSDNIGNKVNNIAEKRFGTEHFWPVTGDFVREMDKCARILRAFTVEGVVKEETVTEGKAKKKAKVLRKIPPQVIKQAKGVAIFTAMRSGIAPLGGAGGSGMVIARLPDGSWSAPSSITPNNLSTGLLIGLDVYDCVLIIRSQAALDSFSTHKVTLGAEIGVAAGPYGAGAAMEAGKEKAPVFSYVKSRGLYAGVEVVGQVFVERYEENGQMYHWPGVKAGDILSGKVRVPVEAAALHAALRDAETGKAQAEKGGGALDIILNSANSSRVDLQLSEGEVLKLPPTPDQTDGTEFESDPETERIRHSDHYPVNPGFTLPPPRSDAMLAPPPRHPSRAASPARRLPPRPPIVHQQSSQSHYSDEEDTPDVPPPQYEPGSVDGGPVAAYPDDKKTASGRDTTGMSESERLEWEQHWREEDDEALRQALEASKLDVGSSGQAAGLADAEDKVVENGEITVENGESTVEKGEARGEETGQVEKEEKGEESLR